MSMPNLRKNAVQWLLLAQAFPPGSGKGTGMWAGETCFGLFITAMELERH